MYMINDELVMVSIRGDLEINEIKLSNIFKGKDLRLSDGSSYIETMKMLLGMDEPTSIGALSMANVNPSLKAELRRTKYWERH